ncbi:MAG: single-stranded DNA-binding protein, partial [Bacteroidales bacterium]|nr:single-stranded DNA-binding protein [Bacteroidales bacterium]
SWQGQDNTTHYTTEILADVIRMMEPKSAREGQPVATPSAPAQPFAEQSAQTQAVAEPTAFQPAAEPEDDLPF